MILGISTYTFGWAIGVEGNRPQDSMTELNLVDVCVKQNLRCLQVGDNLPLHTFSVQRLQEFKSLLRSATIRPEVGAKELTDENLNRYLTICQELEAPLLRFVIDGDDYKPSLDTVAALLRNALTELKKRKVIVGIENHDRFKARELAQLMDKTGNDHVGICLDCVNSMGAGEGLEHVATILAPYTVNLHIKDFRVQRLPHKMGFKVEGEKAGKGMTDVPYLLELITKYNRCETAVLEQWVPPDKDVSQTIEKERRWATEGIQFLKSLPSFSNN